MIALTTTAAGADDIATSPPVLRVDDVTRARELHREDVTPGAVLVLSYVHSSEHVTVRGTIVVQADGTLRPTETAFTGFGPGLPEPKAGDAWRRDGEMIVAAGTGQRLSELRVRVAPFTRHRLRMPSGTEIDLSAAMADGGTVRISVDDSRRAAAAPRGRRP